MSGDVWWTCVRCSRYLPVVAGKPVRAGHEPGVCEGCSCAEAETLITASDASPVLLWYVRTLLAQVRRAENEAREEARYGAAMAHEADWEAGRW